MDAMAIFVLMVELIGTIAFSASGSIIAIRKKMDEIVSAFAKVPVHPRNKVRVGIVGEIYVKFAPLGNNNLEEFQLK